jgi:hypothetical protein
MSKDSPVKKPRVGPQEDKSDAPMMNVDVPLPPITKSSHGTKRNIPTSDADEFGSGGSDTGSIVEHPLDFTAPANAYPSPTAAMMSQTSTTVTPTELQDQTEELILQLDQVLLKLKRPKNVSFQQLIDMMPQLTAAYNSYIHALPSIDLSEWEFASGADDLERTMDQAGIIQSTQERALAVQAVLADVAGAIFVEKQAV